MTDLDPRHIRVGDIPIAHLNAIKQNAIKQKHEFTTSPEYLNDLFIKQNKKCALSGTDICFTPYRNASGTRAAYTTASLDRIDCSKGYIEGNVRWTHKDINKMRSNHDDEKYYEYCRISHLYHYKLMNSRPSFDEYFIMMAAIASLRSDDPDIKHGAIITNMQNHIIGTGYNNTIRNADEEKIPYNIRDKKRLWMIHAEENAILNCSLNPSTIGGAKLYVTAIPCVHCLQRVVNFGITEIHYIDRPGTITENEETYKMRADIVEMSGIKMISINIDNFWLKKFY